MENYHFGNGNHDNKDIIQDNKVGVDFKTN